MVHELGLIALTPAATNAIRAEVPRRLLSAVLRGHEAVRRWVDVGPPVASATPTCAGGDEVYAEVAASASVQRLAESASASAQEAFAAARLIARWAELSGWLATAYRFLALAAALAPGDPRAALRASRLARRSTEYGEAEIWLQHAIALSGQTGDRASLALAYATGGNTAWQRGNYRRARQLHLQCLEIALADGLRELGANSHHDLAVLEGESGDFPAAIRHASEAFRLYGETHPKIHDLAHDSAFILAKHGYYRTALRIHLALLPLYRNSRHWILLWSAIGYCAGSLGNAALYDRARGMISEAVHLQAESPENARALESLAAGAGRLKLWRDAEEMGQAALALARARGEGEIAISSEQLLIAYRAASEGEEVSRAVAPATAEEAFADELIGAVERHPT